MQDQLYLGADLLAAKATALSYAACDLGASVSPRSRKLVEEAVEDLARLGRTLRELHGRLATECSPKRGAR